MTNHQHTKRTEEELGYPTEASGRIPSFSNREEEAAFWDTHDVTEYIGQELQPVDVIIGGELAGRLTLRLGQADRAELARIKGVGPSTLARMWLKERLRQEAKTTHQETLFARVTMQTGSLLSAR